MIGDAPTQAVAQEAVDQVEQLIPPTARFARPAALQLNVRGRSICLRGLHREPRGLMRGLAILGPGLIAACAGNDAGGIATYSQAGAQFGYDFIWVMILLIVALGVVQEMCARLGAATGRGLLDLIRERFGIGWALFAVGVILVANGGLVVSEFVGLGAAADLLGISRYLAIPLGAVVLWYLVIFGSYAWVEKIFLAMTLVFFVYPVAAFTAHPHWHEVARGAFEPRLQANQAYIFLLVGLLGTTVTPYMQLFQQSSLVEKGVARKHYGPERIDTYFGSFFGNVMSIFMIMATAATLHVMGKTDIATAADAALALRQVPVIGVYDKALFAVGLLGASLLAGAVLPLATAYAVSEAFGVPKGVSLDFRRGRLFFGLYSAITALGAGLALIPHLPVIQLLLWIQVLNGALLPIILVFILLLVNDGRLMRDLKNSTVFNIMGWGTFGLITAAVVVLLVGMVAQHFGINLFGGK